MKTLNTPREYTTTSSVHHLSMAEEEKKNEENDGVYKGGGYPKCSGEHVKPCHTRGKMRCREFTLRGCSCSTCQEYDPHEGDGGILCHATRVCIRENCGHARAINSRWCQCCINTYQKFLSWRPIHWGQLRAVRKGEMGIWEGVAEKMAERIHRSSKNDMSVYIQVRKILSTKIPIVLVEYLMKY